MKSMKTDFYTLLPAGGGGAVAAAPPPIMWGRKGKGWDKEGLLYGWERGLACEGVEKGEGNSRSMSLGSMSLMSEIKR